MIQKRDALKKIAVSALSISAAGVFSACSERKAEFRGIDVTGAEYARDLPLTDHNGQQRSLKDFAGKVVVVLTWALAASRTSAAANELSAPARAPRVIA